MFGYVKVYKPELKIKHYEAYKGIYCSVCSALGRNYGLFARMTLSYDVTMLTLTRLCAEEKTLCFYNKRCPFNPSKKCNFCKNNTDEFDYAAAVGVLLTYYKLLDNIHDDGFLGKLVSLLLLPFILRAAKKAMKKYGDISELIKTAMEEQSRLEKDGCSSPDDAAEPVSALLSKLFSHGLEGAKAKILSSIGYCMGKFIYTADACADIEKDIKKNSYNVFVNLYFLSADSVAEIQKARERAKKILFCCSAEAAKAFELLGENSLSPICNNIFYDGMYNTICTVTSKEKKRKEKSDEESL